MKKSIACVVSTNTYVNETTWKNVENAKKIANYDKCGCLGNTKKSKM